MVLGLLAHRVTSDEARADWLRANRPSEATWNLLLTDRRYVEVLGTRELETLDPFLPYLKSGRDPRVWITEDSRVFVRFEPEGTRVFTLGKGTPERIPEGTWEPLGDGWQAFQALQLRTLPVPREAEKPMRTKGKIRYPLDSRALSY